MSNCLKQWAGQLAASSDCARLEAEILFRHVSGWSDTELLLRDHEPLEPSIRKDVEALIRLRAQGHPIAYLIEEREFYSLSLKISTDVLIPRPETELLVDRALAYIRGKPDARVLDLGTGSGAIALAIASNAPRSQVLATDICPKSLALARDNAGRHGLTNVSFLLSDWYALLGTQRFDLIVSNPPYIDPADAHLQCGDLRFEPKGALVSEDRGLADIGIIVAGAGEHLQAEGLLAVEHGFDQGAATRRLMAAAGFPRPRTEADINQLDRVTFAGQS